MCAYSAISSTETTSVSAAIVGASLASSSARIPARPFARSGGMGELSSEIATIPSAGNGRTQLPCCEHKQSSLSEISHSLSRKIELRWGWVECLCSYPRFDAEVFYAPSGSRHRLAVVAPGAAGPWAGVGGAG